MHKHILHKSLVLLMVLSLVLFPAVRTHAADSDTITKAHIEQVTPALYSTFVQLQVVLGDIAKQEQADRLIIQNHIITLSQYSSRISYFTQNKPTTEEQRQIRNQEIKMMIASLGVIQRDAALISARQERNSSFITSFAYILGRIGTIISLAR